MLAPGEARYRPSRVPRFGSRLAEMTPNVSHALLLPGSDAPIAPTRYATLIEGEEPSRYTLISSRRNGH